MVVGVDEAGRGPLAGPVVGCALYLKNDPSFLISPAKKLKRAALKGRYLGKTPRQGNGSAEKNVYFSEKVKDSKEFSPAGRDRIYHWLTQNSIFSLGIAGHKEIDEKNILEATFLAFRRAIKGLIKKVPPLRRATFIIDGNLFRPNFTLNYRCIKGADKKIEEVSCASIVAKVARDYLMKVYDFIYPQWGFWQHKGYPTKEHISLLKKHRLSPLHRRSFSPCFSFGKAGDEGAG